MHHTILLVDDLPETLVLIRLMLERGGFLVSTADDADSTLAMLQEHIPDLFILDIALPGMDGLELLQLLRERLDTRHTPVIVLTARDDPETEARATTLGVSNYIVKPVLAHDLVRKVRQALDLPTNGEGE
jgi:DNA-binding response OmpR family regulator